MKRLLSIVLSFIVLTAFAQEPAKDANYYKGEGNNAYKEKNYEGAYENYKMAIEFLDKDGIVDTVLIYNAGYTAYKAKKYQEAIPFLTRSCELEYKGDVGYLIVAVCQNKLDDYTAMEQTLLKGLELFPGDEKMKEQLASCYLKQGLEFYNEGNDIKSKANESGWNTTDPEKFKAEYALADEKYKEALPFMQKAYDNDPANKNVLKVLVNIYTNLDNQEMVNKFQAELDKLG